MIIQIGNRLYRPNDNLPVMVEFSKQDKWNIRHMPKKNLRYAMVPDSWTTKQAKAWMHSRLGRPAPHKK
jgi:hypothetical protein